MCPIEFSLPCTSGSYHMQLPRAIGVVQLRCQLDTQEITKQLLQNLTYLNPTSSPHPAQKISEMVNVPVLVIQSSFPPTVTLTLDI